MVGYSFVKYNKGQQKVQNKCQIFTEFCYFNLGDKMLQFCQQTLMICRWQQLSKSFGSYRQFAKTLSYIETIASTNAKKSELYAYYSGLTQPQKHHVRNLFSFVQEKPKTGLATKSVATYLNEKYFVPQKEAKILDFQELIRNLSIVLINKKKEQKAFPSDGLLLQEVDMTIQGLKYLVGAGSVDKKMEMICQKLQKMTSSDEIKIFLRILVKNLRIGLKEKSINFGRQEKEDKVIQNYRQYILEELKGIELMLAKPLKNIEDLWEFCDKKISRAKQNNRVDEKILADLKYDGERTLLCFDRRQGLTMMSRKHKTQEKAYQVLAKQIEQELNSLPSQIQSLKIDGEIVCLNSQGEQLPMQYILTLRRSKAEMMAVQTLKGKEDNLTLLVYAFDILQLNGRDLKQLPLIQRRSQIPQTQSIKISKCQQFTYPEEKDGIIRYFLKVIEEKHEGLIIKGSSDHYFTNGTRRHWGKFKKGCKIQQTDTGEIDLDLVVMGVDYGKGRRSQHFSAFLIGAYSNGKLYPITKVGSGFSDQQVSEMTQLFKNLVIENPLENMLIPKFVRVDHFVQPSIVFKVICQDVTRSPLYNYGFRQGYGGISLRFPIFECIRQDKSPEDCQADVLNELAKDI